MEALREESTMAELAARYDVHPNLIATWKRKAKEQVLSGFTGKQEHQEASREAEIKELVMHIPAPRLHLVRCYGHYSHVSRARRRRAELETAGEAPQPGDLPEAAPLEDEVSRAERRRLRRQWA